MNSSEIYILGNEPQPSVIKCVKNDNGDFLCNPGKNDRGDNGFWKLGKNNYGYKWYRCKTPFKKINGKIDYTDFSDCVITNYPFFLEKNGGVCQVKTLDGKIVENSCQDAKCCTEGETCSSLDCVGYKSGDRFLIGNKYNYKCNGVSCEKVADGKGDYTNPFCDYQCSSNNYPKNYTCIKQGDDNVCKQVSDPEKYPIDKLYDNPFCDGHCVSDDNISYDCIKQGGENKCIQITGKKGKYSTFYDCYQVCGKDTDIIEKVKKEKYTVPIIIGINFILVFLILFFMSRVLKKE